MEFQLTSESVGSLPSRRQHGRGRGGVSREGGLLTSSLVRPWRGNVWSRRKARRGSELASRTHAGPLVRKPGTATTLIAFVPCASSIDIRDRGFGPRSLQIRPVLAGRICASVRLKVGGQNLGAGRE